MPRTLPYPDPGCSRDDRKGFGLAPEPAKTRKSRMTSAQRVIALFKRDAQDATPEDLEALSEVKGLFNRTQRQDQWDWFTTWARLGCPYQEEAREIGTSLGYFRKHLRDADSEMVARKIGFLKDGDLIPSLEHYIAEGTRIEEDVIYVLAHGPQANLFTVGMTSGDVLADVTSASLATERPLGVQAVWLAERSTLTLEALHEVLEPWRVRSLEGVFAMDLEDLRMQVEDLLEEIENAIGA